MKTALVTGSAGFIGFHVAQRWLDEGWRVIGIDSLTNYYDPALKVARNDILEKNSNYLFHHGKIEEPGLLKQLMAEHAPQVVIHLAAQAGVRYSIEAPRSYVDANLLGTYELLEAARAHPPAHMLLASTSSVYGANTDLPYVETAKADHQVSFYAATKKANEAMAHSYAHLYGLQTTMFRFFTVYGPWGRPDMALFKFVKAILEDRPIDIYNHGKMKRDFTYIDDLVEAIWRLSSVSHSDAIEDGTTDSLSPVAPYRIVNIGKSQPDTLIEFVSEIESALGKVAEKNFLDMQAGDVLATESETEQMFALTGHRCATPLSEGIPKFIEWYRAYYQRS
ncbi:MAG: NAD-dependent epimerase/dehydratase family protein [Boseongicola sp.]|nr:NAD-dependent epimerase/dehydratase family protein [Boseongicola sp.]